jgi:hypothetical protein
MKENFEIIFVSIYLVPSLSTYIDSFLRSTERLPRLRIQEVAVTLHLDMTLYYGRFCFLMVPLEEHELRII